MDHACIAHRGEEVLRRIGAAFRLVSELTNVRAGVGEFGNHSEWQWALRLGLGAGAALVARA